MSYTIDGGVRRSGNEHVVHIAGPTNVEIQQLNLNAMSSRSSFGLLLLISVQCYESNRMLGQ